MKRTYLLLVLMVLIGTFGFAVLARYVVVPVLFQLDSSFRYSVNILSFDNFYDEEERMFSGAQRSVTTFLYAALESGPQNSMQVENTFDVKTVDGSTIVTIDRQYAVNKITWQHNPEVDPNQRSGFLFAPRNVSRWEPFPYWHVNYDRQLNMVFDGEEVIAGLPTYRYVAEFGVDQTDDLTHLPGVPDERGVNLDVSLTLWVEPVSGWLVKYEDNAIAYYYDQSTGGRLLPWNKFNNRYSQNSILDQVQTARAMRWSILALELGLPLAISLSAGVVALVWLGRRQIAFVVLGSGLLVMVVVVGYELSFLRAGDPLVIGISRWVPEGNTAYDENIDGFKSAIAAAGYREGRDIIYLERTAASDSQAQLEIAREFVESDVDLVYSLTTPGTQILAEHIENKPIVFSVVTYPVEAGLVESIETTGNNLTGTRNWVPVTDQMAILHELIPTARRLGFIHRDGELNSIVQLTELQKAVVQYGIEVVEIAAVDVEELDGILESQRSNIDVLYSACDTLVQGEAESTIITFAQENSIPSFSCNESGPKAGDLAGLVADFRQIGQTAGERASLILSGVLPSALPVTTVVRPHLYVNQATADALGIVVPQEILIQAEEIYQ